MLQNNEELDTGFGTNGIKSYSSQSDGGFTRGGIRKLEVLADGSIQAFVSSTIGNSSSSHVYLPPRQMAWDYTRSALLQVGNDFEPDTTVATNGWARLSNYSEFVIHGVRWRTGGRIVVPGPETHQYLRNFDPDTTFGNFGRTYLSNTTLPPSDEAYGVTVAPGGSIFVGGQTRGTDGLGNNPMGFHDYYDNPHAVVLKFDSSGGLDESYDGFTRGPSRYGDGDGRITYSNHYNTRNRQGSPLTDVQRI